MSKVTKKTSFRGQKESKFKTDPCDALKIAKALRSGDLSSIHIPDKQLQEDRSLIRYRHQLRKDIVRQKCRVKSFLAFYSIEIPGSYTKSKWPRRLIRLTCDAKINPAWSASRLYKRLPSSDDLDPIQG